MGDLRIYIYTLHTPIGYRKAGHGQRWAKSHKQKQLGPKFRRNQSQSAKSGGSTISEAKISQINQYTPYMTVQIKEKLRDGSFPSRPSTIQRAFFKFTTYFSKVGSRWSSLKNNWLEEFRQTSRGVRGCCCCQPASKACNKTFGKKHDQLLFEFRKI